MGAGAQGRAAPAGQPGRWRHRFALLTCAATLFLIFAGGMVTSTGSGLAVPDWPLSYGTLFPPMVGGVFYEHGHRMVAGCVALLTLALALWLRAAEPRRWVRRLGALALAAVVVQAILGGITVLLLLPPAVSISHAGLANLFFCLTVTLAAVTGPWWTRAGRAPSDDPGRAAGRALFVPAAAVASAAYIQILLGALMRHTKAGLAIPTFPLAFGRLVPPLEDPKVAVHFAHRLGALAVAAVAGWCLYRAIACARGRVDLLLPAALLGILVTAQWTLGAFTVWTAKGPVVTTFHVAGGSATLGIAVLLALRAGRLRGAAAREPVRGGVAAAAQGPA